MSNKASNQIKSLISLNDFFILTRIYYFRELTGKKAKIKESKFKIEK